jgi:TM2 domain-containing membrane protein YozV
MYQFTVCMRCWVLLLAMLALGSCQRSVYSFQPAGSTRLLATTMVPDSATAVALAVPSLSAPLPLQAASRPRSRHTTAWARLLTKPLTSLQKVPQVLQLAQPTSTAHRVASHDGSRQEPLPGASPTRWRTKGIALLLAFFLGGLGAHLFYLGYHGRAMAYLAATLVGFVFLVLAVIMAVASVYGGGAGYVAVATISTIITGVVGLLTLVDLVRIAIGNLKPKNGEYFPRLFQTHDKP